MDKDLEQKKLQIEIKTLEKKELEVLASTVLNETQKNEEKEKITKEIVALKLKLEEIQRQTDESKKEIIEVKNNVEITSKWAYTELIKGSAMETQLKALNKTDAQIEQIALRIDAVVRKYYEKELTGFPPAIINGMCAGTQPAMIEALATSGIASSEVFAATANGLSDTGISSLFEKITSLVDTIKSKASGLVGPLMGEGPLPNLAKRVQNLTAFVVLHKNDFSDGTVPQLVNPYKYKELLNNPVRNTTKNFDKPETLALFTLHTAEGAQLQDDEKKKLQDIVNNPQLVINEQTITNMEKALDTTDKFLDKRSFRQDTFMGMFDKIRGPLSLFFGKGKNMLPSDILGHGLFATALGASSLDARYLSKNIIPTQTTSPTQQHEQGANKLTDEQLKTNINAELKKTSEVMHLTVSITADMVISTSKKFKVPAEYIMAIMKNDSHYGTDGIRAINNHNPGNVGNTDDGKNKYFASRNDGVDAVGENLQWRIKEYQKVYGVNNFPAIKELADNVGPDGKGFLLGYNYKQANPKRVGAYMSAATGGTIVQSFTDELAQAGISNQDQLFTA